MFLPTQVGVQNLYGIRIITIMGEEMRKVTSKSKVKEIPVWGWCVIIGYMVLASFLPSGIEGWALTAGWFVIAGMCLWNYQGCRRIHCAITGPGFVGIGIVSLLEVLGIIDVASWIIWTAFGAIMGVGFGLEFLYRRKFGSCYRITTIDRL